MAKRINTTLSIVAAAATFAHGDVVPPGPANPANAANARVNPTAESSTAVMASRLLTGPVGPQIAFLRSKISINGQEMGPFGFFQDPEKAAEQVIDIPLVKPEEAVETPFRDVVRAIPISMVIPSTQEFLVNSRTIRIGNQFPLVVGNSRITVRVERVRSSGVVFRNIKTGELAEQKIEFLPAGVIRSKGGEILPDGMVPTGRTANQELVIDPANINPTTNGASR